VSGNSNGTVEVAQSAIEIDGLKTYFNRAGEGNPEVILMLHGSGPGATAFSNWRLALPHFGERYDCIAPDMAGYGLSESPDPMPTNMRDWNRFRTERNFALLDALGIEGPVHVMGNSMGGRLALEMLHWDSSRIDRAILMGSAGSPIRFEDFTAEHRQLARFFDDPTPRRMSQIISWFTYDPEFIGDRLDEIAVERVEAAMLPGIPEGHITTFSEPLDLEVPETALKRIQNRTLLLHGDSDVYVEPFRSQYLHEKMPNAHLHMIPKCGHWVQIERPDAFNGLSQLFLDGGMD
jgi:2-hydroxymuconate-semialdehyde hydrolase